MKKKHISYKKNAKMMWIFIKKARSIAPGFLSIFNSIYFLLTTSFLTSWVPSSNSILIM